MTLVILAFHCIIVQSQLAMDRPLVRERGYVEFMYSYEFAKTTEELSNYIGLSGICSDPVGNIVSRV